MNKKILFILWGALFVLCAGLGFIPEPQGAVKGLMTGLSVLFFLPTFLGWQDRQRYIRSRQNSQFRKTVRQQQAQERYAPYHHKCAVCGRTDTDHPDLQFRYCSRCAGYHCFCQDHIFNHIHFEEE